MVADDISPEDRKVAKAALRLERALNLVRELGKVGKAPTQADVHGAYVADQDFARARRIRDAAKKKRRT